MPFNRLAGAARLSRLVLIAGGAAVLTAPAALAATIRTPIRPVADREAIASQSNWPQFRYGYEHTGFNRAETILGTGNVARLKRVWAAAAPGMVDSTPAVVNGVVYVGTAGHRVVPYQAATGKLLWNVVTGGELLSSPAVADAVVYVGSADGYLYALKASTGQRLWRFPAGAIYSSPALASGVLYVTATTKSNVPVTFAVSAATGHKLWSSPGHGD
jgi:glucose dehydrogenase